VNKRALEALIRSGAFDNLGPKVERDYDRAVMSAAMGEAVKAAEQSAANTSAGMSDLFGEVVPSAASGGDVYADFRSVRTWSMKERLNHEKDTLGLYLTGHPIDQYRHELKHIVSSRIVDLKADRNSQQMAGLVVAMRVMKTKKGDNMAFVTLDDRSGRIEVAIFSDTYNEYREKLVKDGLLVITGQVSFDEYSGGLKVRAESVRSLDDARMQMAKSLQLKLFEGKADHTVVKKMSDTLKPYIGGNCPITVCYERQDALGNVIFGEAWKVEPVDALLDDLRDILGREAVELVY
jgi:DNA polymerase-3 subunit alpha